MRAGRGKVWFGIALVGGIVAMALLADLIAPHDPYRQNLMLRLRPPVWDEGGSMAYPLGTDNFGRDLLSRLIHGSRLSVMVGISAMLLAATIGTTLGLIAGWRGGRAEALIMRLADAQLAIPEILLAILVVAAIGGSAVNLVLVLGISGWMVHARVVFGLTRSLRERPFVEAAVSQGATGGFIVTRHILPHLLPVMSVVATLQVAQMILQETALSFLGLGLPPPAATWGNILAEGRERLFVAPWIANLAGLAIVLLVWGVNILGNGLRERFDPRS
jgi:peptide/nickel transport system permease protein